MTLKLPPPSARYGGFRTFGDVMNLALPAYALTRSAADSDWEGSLQLAYTTALSQTAVWILKNTTKIRRPTWQPGDNGKMYSFPSGHTASVFSAASYLHLRYGWKEALIPYSLAAATGCSRVWANAHRKSEALVGAALAVGFSLLVVRPREDSSLEIIPVEGGAAIVYTRDL